MQKSNIDWATKITQGRVKAYGVPWTEEELLAIRDGKATVEELRDQSHAAEAKARKSVATKEGNADAKVEKPLDKMLKPELAEKAKSLGLDLPYAETTAKQFIEAIEAKNATAPKGPESTDANSSAGEGSANEQKA